MKIITTRDIVRQTKTYFDLSEKERIAVKRKDKYVILMIADDPGKIFVNEDWINEFMSIPEAYRVNPFEVSASGDLFFADKRNLDHIDKALKGNTITLSDEEEQQLFSL